MKKTSQLRYPNVIQCLKCRYVLVSNHRHDFNKCPCENETFIDGGYDYLRFGGVDQSKILFLSLRKHTRVIKYKRGK